MMSWAGTALDKRLRPLARTPFRADISSVGPDRKPVTDSLISTESSKFDAAPRFGVARILALNDGKPSERCER